jgi:hypothetical protein
MRLSRQRRHAGTPPRFLQVESLEGRRREIRSRASLSGLETDRSAASIRAIRSDSGRARGLRATDRIGQQQRLRKIRSGL